MLHVLSWWLVLQAIGLLALPIALRLLRFLPDRGFGFARPVGLILSAFVFWLLVTLGILQNTTACIVFILLLMGGFSAYLWLKEGGRALAILKRRWHILVITECVFLGGLAAFALFRAYSPDIAGTEKPMEFAFINGILRSRTFPPRDPWLSGYAISYYYFGYVMTAMLTKLSGVSSGVAFNLMGSTLFALTVSGSFSLVYNMVQAHLDHREEASGDALAVSGTAVGTGFLGAILVALMGNLEGIFELLRAHGGGSEALWRWLDVRSLRATPPSSTWYPDDSWWWWRASRVIHDVDAAGRSMEVISEFPFFSFLLGDNHPHVLALPFVLLALALALNLVLHRSGEEEAGFEADEGESLWHGRMASIGRIWPGDILDFVLYAVVVGGLGFLNTWDYPIYLGILVLGYAVRRHAEVASRQEWFSDVFATFAALLFVGILAYLPFYISFRSQAGGIGWVGEIKTRLHQYLVMMGIFVFLQIGFLLSLISYQGRRGGVAHLPWLAIGAIGLFMLLVVFCLLRQWWTAAFIWTMVALSTVLWLSGSRGGWGDPLSPSTSFALLMVAVGFALTGSVEFIFLRDTFGTRMNTIFKFYYQAWVLLAIASAYGVFRILCRWERLASVLERVVAGAWLAVAGVLVLAGLSYTVAATASRAGGFRGEPTLDGTRYVREHRRADYEAIQWLEANAPPGSVLLEAPGGSYSEYNWVSAHTGIPTLLGWGGHELQWRGNYDEPGRREPDIASIYQSLDRTQKKQLLEKYGVDFVYVGRLEKNKYDLTPSMIGAFDGLMKRCYEGDGVIIYCWSP